MKNFIYWDTVESKLLEVLTDGIPEDIAKSVILGDFTNVPSPNTDNFQDFFPAILINISDTEIAYDNTTTMTTSQQYNFQIYYLNTYDVLNRTTNAVARQAAKSICNVLMSDRTLGDLYIEKSDDEVGMQGLGGEVINVSFDNETSDLFYQMEIPINATIVTYGYLVKTFRL